VSKTLFWAEKQYPLIFPPLNFILKVCLYPNWPKKIKRPTMPISG
jgi:hypothetical protein